MHKGVRLPDNIAELAVYMVLQTSETMTGQLVSAREDDEEHGIRRLSAYYRLHTLLPFRGDPTLPSLPKGCRLVVQVDGGDDPGDVSHNAGGVSAASQILGEVDVSWAKSVDGTVPQTDFRLAGQGDQVLPAGRSCQSPKKPGGKARKTISLAFFSSIQAGWEAGSTSGAAGPLRLGIPFLSTK